MAAPLTAIELGDLIVRSELIGRTALDDYLADLDGPVPYDAAGLADVLIRDGQLTPFQARLLLQGKWRNFFLSGKYKVIDHLGDGGMGMVYLCEHRHMRRRVAVKILPPEQQDPTSVQRFVREAQAVAMLNHPNIVRAYDIDQEAGLHFIVMEYIDGVSLQVLVDARGPLAIDRTVHYVAQAGCGLQHANSKGLVHRDVKPSNLMLDQAGAIKVLDLGLARFSRSGDGLTRIRRANGTDTQAILGTADYLAPEQVRGAAVDGRADIYALGAAAFFLLTGRPPFDGGTVQDKLIRHLTEVPARLDAIRPQVPRGLADVIARMLAKSPNDRPETFGHLLADLQPWLVEVAAPAPDEIPSRYTAHHNVDASVRRSTAALVSRSSRALILKTMVATG